MSDETRPSRVKVRHRRRILCVFPRYSRSFGTFHHIFPLMRGVRAFMPPQGLLVIAAWLPETWEVRFIDENVASATAADFDWADAVFCSGMHIQRSQLLDINRRAHQFGKLTVVGGPSVSACPEQYGAFDVLHVGELGDATDALVAHIDRDVRRPAAQLCFQTANRVALTDFPVPAYRLIRMDHYFIGSIQFSSGCPYHCEFCDIPALYGNNPRLKAPRQIVAELDAMRQSGRVNAVYFVDDNFVGNRKAALELVPHLVEWQKAHKYPVEFACECTLNIAKSTKLLELMREAWFCTTFCGIETPEVAALQDMSKKHNLQMPILESIRTLNSFGMEVVSGIIMGLDSDGPQTADHILDFIDESQIPMLTINLLHALPRTPLWDRLQRAGRLVDDERLESNVRFLRPYDEVVASWRRTIEHTYHPDALYRRFAYQVKNTYPHRISPPPQGRATLPNIVDGLVSLSRTFWTVGVRSDYRRTFWDMAWPLLKKGDIESLLHVALVAHHLIKFSRECVRGDEAASFYAQRARDDVAAVV